MDIRRMREGRVAAVLLAVSTAVMAACRPASAPEGRVSSPDAIRETIEAAKAPLTLVHVWATWCDPCREEFPEVLRAYRDTHELGLDLKLVSADDPADLQSVNRFLQEQQSPVGSLVSTELNQKFIQLFSPNWSGALPASFFFSADGKLVAEWQGKRSYKEYYETIERLLNP